MLKNKLLKFSRRIFEPLGLALTNGSHFTDDAALKRCKERGMIINSVIDVGASDGRWSDLCMEHFPNAQYLLVEAQAAHESSLIKYKKANKNVEYVICAAGNNDGEIYFNDDALLSGVASDKPFEGGKQTKVPMFKIDTLIKNYNLKPPFLIKLDTHGFEVPIIEGSSEALQDTNLFIVETYNFRISEKALKYFEMCIFMEKLGFSTADIVGLLSREFDKALWQMDMFFVKSNDKIFEHKNYN